MLTIEIEQKIVSVIQSGSLSLTKKLIEANPPNSEGLEEFLFMAVRADQLHIIDYLVSLNATFRGTNIAIRLIIKLLFKTNVDSTNYALSKLNLDPKILKGKCNEASPRETF